MTFALVATSSVLAVLLALGWAKEFRLRRALQNLMTRILTHWRNAHEEIHTSSTQSDVAVLLVMTAGCGDAPDFRDQRLAEFARESMIEQRIQNERMADQSEAVVRESNQLAETAKLLVEHDARTRREMMAAQSELTSQLNQQQAVVDAGRDQLERERQQIAEKRHRDPMIAMAIENAGLAMAGLLPLIICFFVIRQMQTQEPDHAAVAELLIQEFSGEQPRLLPGLSWRPVTPEHDEHHRLSDTTSEEGVGHRGERPF